MVATETTPSIDPAFSERKKVGERLHDPATAVTQPANPNVSALMPVKACKESKHLHSVSGFAQQQCVLFCSQKCDSELTQRNERASCEHRLQQLWCHPLDPHPPASPQLHQSGGPPGAPRDQTALPATSICAGTIFHLACHI